MSQILLVGFGGFIGSVIRYLSTITLQNKFAFPTLLVNLLGSFIIGVLLYFGQSRLGQGWFYFLVPGILGGFTTYSTFSGEIFILLKNQTFYVAALYATGTLLGSVILAALGYYIAKAVLTNVI